MKWPGREWTAAGTGTGTGAEVGAEAEVGPGPRWGEADEGARA
jgi:hypothetical protein